VDGLSCRAGLSAAVRTRWTGRLQALNGSDPVGLATLVRGRFAWLASSTQSTNVASLLVRLGGVSQQRLDAVRELYRASGRDESFASALRQAKLVPDGVLRRCLLLHHRAALRSLVGSSGVRLERREVALSFDEDLLFTLGEIMPELSPKAAGPDLAPPSTGGPELSGAERLLAPLAEMPGHRACAVVDAEGRVLAACTRSPAIEAAVLGAVLASAVEAATRLARFSAMGSVNFLVVSCEAGTLVGRWVDPARRHFVAAVVAEEAQIGMAKYRIGSLLPAIADRIAHPAA